MKWRALLSTTLSIAFSGPALAMGGPVYVDETCETMTLAHSTPELRAWLKRQCPQGDASPNAICKDLVPFIKDVAANNENWRRKCAEQKQ